jgi:hypothetical protein
VPKPGAPVVGPTAPQVAVLPPVPAGLVPPVPPVPAGLVPPVPPVPAGLVPPVPPGVSGLEPQAPSTKALATATICVRAKETRDNSDLLTK